MYTINFYNRSFRSKENIQPLLDELTIKTTLLEYKVNTRFIDYTGQYIYYIFFSKSQHSFTIAFYIDKKTKMILSIHTTYYTPQRSIKYQQEETNFTRLLKEINQNL